MILLDTCALLWWSLDPQSLSKSAADACMKAEEQGTILVSTISIWEVGIKHKNKKLDLGMTLDNYVRLLQKVSALQFIPVTNDIWIKSLAFDWAHKDLVDRVIVATALLEHAPLISKDAMIRKFHKKTIW